MPASAELSSLISVGVNGQLMEVPAGCLLPQLLELLNVPADRVAVEIDKSIVRRRDWAHTPITAGAQIEIVEFVGGG